MRWQGEANGVRGDVESTAAWSRRAADELWSGVVTPLTFSLLADEMAEHMARLRLAQAGLVDASRKEVFRLVRGYVYVNASLLADVMREVPSILVSQGLLALLPQPLREDIEAQPRSLVDPRTLRTVFNLTRADPGWAPWSSAAQFRDEAARVARDLADFRVPVNATGEELAQKIGTVRARLARFLEVVSWPMVYAYVFFHLTVHLVHRWAPEEESGVARLMAGIPGIRTFEAHGELVELAGILRADADAQATVRSEEPANVAERAARGELGEFGTGLTQILDRHGHRLMERDLSHPSWSENPAIPIEIARRIAEGELEASGQRGDYDPEIADRILRRISSGVTGPIRGALFRASLRLCREYYAVRENMRYHADYFLSALRRLALAAGERLVASGELGTRADVFYLTADELSNALSAAGGSLELARVAARRREEYEHYRARPPAEVLWGDAAESSEEAPAVHVVGGPALAGTGASPGCVDGPARVIRRHEDLESVRAGDIVVAIATDPTWTSFLAFAAGIVLEAGGLLSHGAIVARELGIPAVVDVKGATQSLRSGESIRLDGAAGTVTRV